MYGPFKTTGFNEGNYFVTFIDDYSQITPVYCIKVKDEVFKNLIKFVSQVENLTNKILKVIDNRK